MAIRKAPEGYGITGDIEGPTKWYSGPPIGEGGHTVSVSMSRNLFDRLTTAAKVEEKLRVVLQEKLSAIILKGTGKIQNFDKKREN